MSKRLIYEEDAIDVAFDVFPDDEYFREQFVKGIEASPSAQPDNRLERIADIVEGTIDHLDRDDAMDMLYQIKEVLK